MRGKEQKPFNVSDFMPADRETIDPLEQTWENFRELAKESEHGKH